jgi:predicted PurR-regulated permease PerM
MIFFIAIIFIAQIIIVWNIANFLISFDNKINCLTLNIKDLNNDLPEIMDTLKLISDDINYILEKIHKEIIKHRNKIIINKLKSTIEALSLILLKPKYKKLVIILSLGKKLTKKLIKLKNVV